MTDPTSNRTSPNGRSRPPIMDRLRFRAQLLRDVRQFFEQQGFLEVETPLLSRDTVVDRYIEPIRVCVETPGCSNEVFLQTSPEFAMKRLLCEGARSIYQICKAFRNGEFGPRHNPEFTMLEWYSCDHDYHLGLKFLDHFSRAILGTPPAEIRTYQELFQSLLGVDPLKCETASLQKLASRWVDDPLDLDRDSCLNLCLSEAIEPQLAKTPALIICDWPASQAALAQLRKLDNNKDALFPGTPTQTGQLEIDKPDESGQHSVAVAERYELYVHGVEIANGYHELTDPLELSHRNDRANQLRRADGNPQLPTHSRLLESMHRGSGMPASCGVAVGLDRLLMLRHSASSLADVVAYDFSEA